jgi:hypothetical protein
MKMRLFLAVLAAALCAAGCVDPSSWVLSGEVKFIELRESVDSGGEKKGSLDYSIRNTGRSKIEGTSFAFTYSTDKRKYHFTVVDENAVKAGTLAYGHVSVAYDEPTETGKLESATIDSMQFK